MTITIIVTFAIAVFVAFTITLASFFLAIRLMTFAGIFLRTFILIASAAHSVHLLSSIESTFVLYSFG